MDTASAWDDVISPEAWAAAVNPDLPPGVFELRDADGLWWRYPLAEFAE